MAAAAYVELRCRSAVSFLDGASLPEDLVAAAASAGYDALALGDRDGVYGAPRFFAAARGAGVRPIVGATGGLDEEHGGGGVDFVVDGASVTLQEGEATAVPAEQLVDGGLAGAARAFDAGANDLALPEPEATDLGGRGHHQLPRAALEVEEREHGGEPKLFETAAEAHLSFQVRCARAENCHA